MTNNATKLPNVMHNDNYQLTLKPWDCVKVVTYFQKQ